MFDLERNLMGRSPVSPLDELASMIAELDRFEDVIWDRYGTSRWVRALNSPRGLGEPGCDGRFAHPHGLPCRHEIAVINLAAVADWPKAGQPRLG